jgi:hypothetical protein
MTSIAEKPRCDAVWRDVPDQYETETATVRLEL